jgi:hypothetical protein
LPAVAAAAGDCTKGGFEVDQRVLYTLLQRISNGCTMLV